MPDLDEIFSLLYSVESIEHKREAITKLKQNLLSGSSDEENEITFKNFALVIYLAERLNDVDRATREETLDLFWILTCDKRTHAVDSSAAAHISQNLCLLLHGSDAVTQIRCLDIMVALCNDHESASLAISTSPRIMDQLLEWATQDPRYRPHVYELLCALCRYAASACGMLANPGTVGNLAALLEVGDDYTKTMCCKMVTLLSSFDNEQRLLHNAALKQWIIVICNDPKEVDVVRSAALESLVVLSQSVHYDWEQTAATGPILQGVNPGVLIPMLTSDSEQVTLRVHNILMLVLKEIQSKNAYARTRMEEELEALTVRLQDTTPLTTKMLTLQALTILIDINSDWKSIVGSCVEMLKHLSLLIRDEEAVIRKNALAIIGSLATNNHANRDVISTIKIMPQALGQALWDCDVSVRQCAAAALHNITWKHDANCTLMASAYGLVDGLCSLLWSVDPTTKTCAAGALANMVRNPVVLHTLGTGQGSIEAFLAFLPETENPLGQQFAMRVLGWLGKSAQIRKKLIEPGVYCFVPYVVQGMNNTIGQLRKHCVCALWSVCQDLREDEGCVLVAHPGMIDALAHTMNDNDTQTAYCAIATMEIIARVLLPHPQLRYNLFTDFAALVLINGLTDHDPKIKLVSLKCIAALIPQQYQNVLRLTKAETTIPKIAACVRDPEEAIRCCAAVVIGHCIQAGDSLLVQDFVESDCGLLELLGCLLVEPSVESRCSAVFAINAVCAANAKVCRYYDGNARLLMDMMKDPNTVLKDSNISMKSNAVALLCVMTKDINGTFAKVVGMPEFINQLMSAFRASVGELVFLQLIFNVLQHAPVRKAMRTTDIIELLDKAEFYGGTEQHTKLCDCIRELFRVFEEEDRDKEIAMLSWIKQFTTPQPSPQRLDEGIDCTL